MNDSISRRLAITALFVSAPAIAHADVFSDLFGSVFGKKNSGSSASGALGGLGFSKAEADSALREALTIGAGRVVSRLGAPDGYFADPKVHIPLPKSLREIQSMTETFGASKPLDDLELKLNRGAEAAAPKAKSLFISAIKAMTVQDAVGIVKGGDTAGTEYLKGKTLPSLTSAFTPPLKTALIDVGALKAADSVSKTVSKYGYKKDLRGELVGYAVESALSGMFLYLGEEETAIRENPVKRSTALLKKVFGAV
ncbi:MAG: DUF4197 domain-containing protein [Caulobacterales bacterium]